MDAVTKQPQTHRNIIRPKAAYDKAGISQSAAYRLEKKGEFPRRVKLSKRSSGYIESEIDEWIDNRPRVELAGQNIAE